MKDLLLVVGLTLKALLVGGIWCGVAGLRLLARLAGKMYRSVTDAGS